MKRFEERKEDLQNATNRLKEALNEEQTDIVIDGILHRYEFTFELAWKTMKNYLEYPRNSSSHLYDENASRIVYEEIKNTYIYQFDKLLEKI